MADLKQIITDIAKAIVDSPDEVNVTSSTNEEGVTRLSLKVAQDDIGKVVGKHGKIARAIRTVVKSAAGKDSSKVFVDID